MTTNHQDTSTLSAPNRSINELGGEFDFAKFLETNVTKVIIFAVVIIAGIVIAGLIITSKDKVNEEFKTKIEAFEKNNLVDFAKTKDATKLVGDFSVLVTQVDRDKSLFPLDIKIADQLAGNGHKKEAISVLELGRKISRNDYMEFYIETRMAAFSEDVGQIDEAIKSLNTLAKLNVNVFEGKTYLDLGRLYLKKGDKEKAKSSFQYVVDKANTDAEFVKMAKLYLAKI